MPDEIKGMSKDDQVAMIQKDTQRLLGIWRPRKMAMMHNRDVVNVVKPLQKSDEIKWYTNEPTNLFETSRALMSMNQPKFRLPQNINFTPKQKLKMNKAERLATGIYRTMDHHVAEVGGVSWLYDLSYWVLMGWWAVFNWVEKGTDGTVFHGDIWDPINVYPEWDLKGLKRCIRTYELTNAEAETMASDFQAKGLDFRYGEAPEGKMATLINYWYRDFGANDKPRIWNAITLNDVLVKPMTKQPGLRRIPVQVGAIGSPDKVSVGWQERMGRAITALNEDEWAKENTMESLMATILAAQAYPNIVEKTRTGQPAHDATELSGYGSKVTYRTDESIETLKNATTPAEVELLLASNRRRIQEGGLPSTIYGNQPFEISGFALSQYTATLKYKLGPYLNAMQFVLSRMMSDFLYQYRIGRYGKLTLTTGSPADLRRGLSYVEEFEPEDVPERIYVEVTIPITSQFDKTQLILNAKQALTPPQFYSRETLWEMDGDIDDFEVERARIKQDQIEADPFIQGLDILMAMKNRQNTMVAQAKELNNQGRVDEAAVLIAQAEALEMYIGMKEQSLSGGPAQSGSGEGAPGIPSSQMPAEARSSPDEANAIYQQGPSGVKRRPQTREERSNSKTIPLYSGDGRALL